MGLYESQSLVILSLRNLKAYITYLGGMAVMGTVIRAKLSENNKYFVEKHRYYELKHFCLQYPDWKKGYSEIEYIRSTSFDPCVFSSQGDPGDPT